MTTTPHDEGREAALAWMAGRLRFERLLADLHSDEVAEVVELTETRHAEAA